MEISLNQEAEDFIGSLEKITIAKVLRTIDLLEKFGHNLGLPHSRALGNGLFELRVRGQQEVRIFYTFHNQATLLLHGFIKKSRRTPSQEIRNARGKINNLT